MIPGKNQFSRQRKSCGSRWDRYANKHLPPQSSQLPTLVLTFTIVLLLSSCTSSSNRGKVLTDTNTGISGLEMAFLKNTPPAISFEQSFFPVMLRVQNTGTYTLDSSNPAIISLGTEKDYTSSLRVETGGRVESDFENEASFYLDGKSPLNTKGDEEIVAYTLGTSKIDPQSESHKSLLVASLCYPYRTELSTSACIDPDPNNLKPIKKSCKVEDLSFSSGQGAPVAITKIEVQMLPTG